MHVHRQINSFHYRQQCLAPGWSSSCRPARGCARKAYPVSAVSAQGAASCLHWLTPVHFEISLAWSCGLVTSFDGVLCDCYLEVYRVSMVAKELPDRRVLLQARVTSMLSRPASITRATLSAPAGYEVQELPQELQFLYPLQVSRMHPQSHRPLSAVERHVRLLPDITTECTSSGVRQSSRPKLWLLQVLPERTVAVLMYMAPHHKASRSARSVPSSLKLDFTVLESVAAAGPVEEISNSQSMPAVSLPGPPPSPAQVDRWPDGEVAMVVQADGKVQ